MAPQDKKEVKAPEKIIPTGERASNFEQGGEKRTEDRLEKREALREEENISQELKREIELMQVDDNLKKQAEQKANKIKFLADDDKLKELINLARERGVFLAIQAAKKMNDPYILDTLHDVLAREGYYKDFIKKNR